jgi:hypothetical protein
MMRPMSLFWTAPAALIILGIAVAQAQSTDRQGTDAPARGRAFSGGVPHGPADPETMPRILNDTREYCDVLRQDIAQIRSRMGEIPPAPAILVREGERMCTMGHFRPGIYRLRSALMMLRPQP